jgi:hypothetical protein
MIHNQFNHARRGIGVFFKVIAMAIGGIVLAGVFGLLFGWLVQLLWNWLMPAVFGLKMISFWQAFGFVILGKILFSGFGLHGDRHDNRGRGRPFHGKREWPDEEWKPGGSYRNWDFYRHYWDEEGKEAFEQYLERKGLKKNKEKTEQA